MSSWLSQGWPCAVPDLDVADARARGAGGRSGAAGPGRRGRTASRTCCGLAADVEGVAGLGLHPEGQLERLDPRLELGLALAAFEVLAVELARGGRAGPAGRRADRSVLDVLDQLLDVGVLAVDVGPLVDARAGTPTASSATRRSG